jgi:hypothetical protein
MEQEQRKAPLSLKSTLLGAVGIVILVALAALSVNARYRHVVDPKPVVMTEDSVEMVLKFNRAHMYLIEDSLVDINGCKSDTITFTGYHKTIDIDFRSQNVGLMYSIKGMANKYQLIVNDGNKDITLTRVMNVRGEECLVIHTYPYLIILSQSDSTCTDFSELPSVLPTDN